MSEMVTLVLAHPLTAAQAERLHAKEVRDYPTSGMKISVPRDDARSIINAGYAADVDPADGEQVRNALESGAGSKASAKSSSSS